MGAAHRSAARAWGARPVPFRTRKLSPIAPRVLRGQPVGGQGAADRWAAPTVTVSWVDIACPGGRMAHRKDDSGASSCPDRA